MTGWLLPVAFVAQLASSLLSAAETACFTLSAPRVRTLEDEGYQGSSPLREVRERAASVQAAALVVSTFLNALAAGALIALAVLLLGWEGGLLAIPGAALLSVVLGEVVPRGIAARWPIRIALGSAPSLLILERFLGGLLTPVVRIEELLAGRGGRNGEGPGSPEERELREMAELGQEQGLLDEGEHQLVERAFRLDDRTAWDVMTPRVDIHAWPDSLPIAQVLEELRTVPHSRVPVFGESIDDITGIVHVRDAYRAWVEGRGDEPLRAIAREPFFLPGSVSLTRLLRDFQSRRIHFGVVADEFGGTDGIVTLEDVIEELVGEIEDETDLPEEPITRISPIEVEVDGSSELREVNRALGVELPDEEHRSVNGFLLEELGRVPRAGESLFIEGIGMEVVEASETQVLRARIRIATDRGGEGGIG